MLELTFIILAACYLTTILVVDEEKIEPVFPIIKFWGVWSLYKTLDSEELVRITLFDLIRVGYLRNPISVRGGWIFETAPETVWHCNVCLSLWMVALSCLLSVISSTAVEFLGIVFVVTFLTSLLNAVRANLTNS